jgi:hypothetical protein
VPKELRDEYGPFRIAVTTHHAAFQTENSESNLFLYWPSGGAYIYPASEAESDKR